MAREKARQSRCASNLKQLGVALQMYAADYDELYPWAADFTDKNCPQIWDSYPQWQALIPTMFELPDVLNPYVKSAECWHCPSDSGFSTLEDAGLPLNATPTCYAAFRTSYVWRTELAFAHITNGSMKDPVGTNVLFDGHGRWHGRTDDLNGKRWIMLFGDGHVKTVNRAGYDAAWALTLQ